MHTGDNRDATYLTALPFNTLSSPGQVLLIAGVNCARAGVSRQGLGLLQRSGLCLSAIAHSGRGYSSNGVPEVWMATRWFQLAVTAQ